MTSNAVLLERMIAAYTSLGDYASPSHHAPLPRIDDTLSFLRTFQGQPLSPQHHPWDRLARFFRLLLDTFGLVLATSGDINALTPGHLSHVGKPRDVAGILAGNDDQFADWKCSTLLQSWAFEGNASGQENRDLRYLLPKGRKVCDFAVGHTLIECKRVHSESPVTSFNSAIPSLTRKAAAKTVEGAAQFTSTADYLQLNACRRILILDMSSYGDWTTELSGDTHVTGLDPEKHITPFTTALAAQWHGTAPDEIVVCWTDLYAFDGIPCALAYRTQAVDLLDQRLRDASYPGWTLEFYPMVGRGPAYKELRLSKVVRPLPWLHTMWLNMSGRLYRVGPEQSVPPPGRGRGG